METTVKDRVMEFIRHKNISVRAFEKACRLSNGYVRGIEKTIMPAKIEAISLNFPELNVGWLLTGEGSMLKPPPDGVPTARHASKNSEGIPLIPISAMAGAFTGDTTVMEYECERYVIPAFKGADFLIQVKGNSMQPTYYAGDLVACQRVPMGDLFFQWGKTYVLDTAQGALIKRIKHGSDNNHVLVVSDNPEYEPFELARDQFYGVALVCGLVRLE